ncbi:MAG: YfhO family protein [Thermoanaerobaculia bacterium]
MAHVKLSLSRGGWIALGLVYFIALAFLARASAVPQPNLPLLVLLSLAVYGGTAAAVLYAAHRWVLALRRGTALLLALAPLLLTGPATLRGAVYAPLDVNFLFEPLTAHRPEAGLVWVQTPLLSDVAFSMIPWQKAVREHVKSGRAPLWNRFVLAGEPLLAVQQSGALHPFTWAGFLLPLAQSWTFQMSARFFLAALSAYLLFRDFGCREAAALLGALGWAFSDFLVFYLGYTVGNAVAPFPLLVLGLTRLVRDADRRAAALTAVALVLITVAGHPESLFFAVTGAGIYFLFLLGFAGAKRRARPLRLALAAGAIALGLTAIQLVPMAEVLPHTWEQALRALDADKPKSVAPRESASRAATALVPYAHGESGHGQVDKGFGVPGAYAGAILLPLAVCGLCGRERMRWALLAVGLFGLALWARLVLVTDALAALPLFDIAVLDYFVWLAVFATCALAALGADRLLAGEGRGTFLAGTALALAGIAAVFFAFEPAMRRLDMPPAFLRERLLLALVPLALGIVLAGWRRASARALAVALLVLLAVPRFLEAREVYPVCSARALSPRLEFLEAIPLGTPVRMVALGEMFVPNVSALYELEDVRGYESMTLRTFVETFPLWATPGSWFNRVDDLDSPFLSFLNVGYAIVPLGYPPPPGWTLRSRDKNADLLSNTRSLPRAFAPAAVRFEAGAGERIELLRSIPDFGRQGVVAGAGTAWLPNGSARVEIASYQAQAMTIDVEAREETIVGTSIPAWPGWKAELDGAAVEPLSYNHAFLGFRVPKGAHRLTLRYRPDGYVLGAAVSLLTLAAAIFLLLHRRP